MNRLLLIILTLIQVNGYIYHNHISIRQPYLIKFKDKSSNDLKCLNEEQAYKLSYFWYNELKSLQNFEHNENKNIEFLYSSPNSNYLEMSNMMTFNYDFTTSQHEKSYLVWKPRIQPQYMNDESKNGLFYPCFRQALSLVSFTINENNAYIENIIYSPFWKGDLTIIQKKSKSLIIDYFLQYLNYSNVLFDSY